MASLKIFIIFIVLFILQSSFAKPVDNFSQPVENDMLPQQSLLIFIVTNLMTSIANFINQSLQISRDILKDEDLLANDKPEVLEFKVNITKFLDIYNRNNDLEKTFEIMDIFVNTTEHYLELPKENETPESVFIVEILNKYKVQEIEIEFKNDFEKFVENLKGLFEAAEKEMSKALLDWFDKFKVLTDVDEQIEALIEFVKLIQENK